MDPGLLKEWGVGEVILRNTDTGVDIMVLGDIVCPITRRGHLDPLQRSEWYELRELT
jgi:hypothetical protein